MKAGYLAELSAAEWVGQWVFVWAESSVGLMAEKKVDLVRKLVECWVDYLAGQ